PWHPLRAPPPRRRRRRRLRLSTGTLAGSPISARHHGDRDHSDSCAFLSSSRRLVSVADNLDFVGARVKTAGAMANSTFSMPLTGLVVAAIALMGSGAAAAADHACDPVDPVMENGWTVVPSDE